MWDFFAKGGLSSLWVSMQAHPVGSFFALAPVALLSALYFKQGMLLYVPYMPPNSRGKDCYRVHWWTPAHPRYQLQYKDIWLTTADRLKIHAWLLTGPHPADSESTEDDSNTNSNREEKSRPTLVYFHGNAGNLAMRLDNVQVLVSGLGCNVLLVSYRGYGLSEGSPSEAGLKKDARAAWDFVLSGKEAAIDPDNTYLFGRSLGGACALALAGQLAAEKVAGPRGIILENTFTSVLDMIDVVMPLFKTVKFMVTSPWRSRELFEKEIIPKTTPMLMLSGGKDELVPPPMMDEILKLRGETSYTYFRRFKEGTHNETFMRPRYYDQIRDFLEATSPKNFSRKDQAPLLPKYVELEN